LYLINVYLYIKYVAQSFWWYKAQFVVYHYKFYEWYQNPFLCLGAG